MVAKSEQQAPRSNNPVDAPPQHIRYPSHAFTNGQSASLVIGQQDFTTSVVSTTQNGFNNPKGPDFDSSGNLWVTDVGNNRILEFSSTVVPEFPTASLAIITLTSMAVVAVVTRRFSVRGLDR